MKIVMTLILSLLIILALLYLLMGALGISIGVRIAGNMFAEEGLASVGPAYLVPLILLACGGLYLLWRGSAPPL